MISEEKNQNLTEISSLYHDYREHSFWQIVTTERECKKKGNWGKKGGNHAGKALYIQCFHSKNDIKRGSIKKKKFYKHTIAFWNPYVLNGCP